MTIPSSEQLDAMRLQGDTLADETVAQIFAQDNPHSLLKQLWTITDNQSLAENDFHPLLKTYFKQVIQPINANTEAQIKHTAAFFERNAQPYLGMLGLLSLPYCYAGEYGAQVLYLSERIQSQTERRLLETSKFVLDVMSPDAFLPAGKGWVSIAQVRLLHALVRKRTRTLPTWDMRWGLPINQEDMLGTNFAFGWIVLRGIEKIGYTITAQDRQALLDTWSLIGKGLGVLPEIMPKNSKEAYWLDKTIAKRHFRASAVGKALTKSLVEYLNPKFPYGLTETYMRYLLGDTIADYIGILPADWKKYLLQVQVLQTNLQNYLPFSLPNNFLPTDSSSFLQTVRAIIDKESIAFAHATP